MDSHIRNGVDYHTIVWEKRALDLDDLLAVPDHLLTGNSKLILVNTYILRICNANFLG